MKVVELPRLFIKADFRAFLRAMRKARNKTAKFAAKTRIERLEVAPGEVVDLTIRPQPVWIGKLIVHKGGRIVYDSEMTTIEWSAG